jgi:hypothetical protein
MFLRVAFIIPVSWRTLSIEILIFKCKLYTMLSRFTVCACVSKLLAYIESVIVRVFVLLFLLSPL